MSAKLLKSLANNQCRVRNSRAGQVRVYWTEITATKHVDIDSGAVIDLTLYAPVECLRKSSSLRNLVRDGHLLVQ